MTHAFRRWLSLPIVRHLRCLQLRRLTPLRGGNSSHGTSVVRYYWAEFLNRHRGDIRGRGLEIGTTETLRKYGGEALAQADALDLSAHSPDVRVVADLARADHVPGDVYDCFIIQFTMTVIYDLDAALYHALRLLRPGGVLLVNFACVDYYLHRGLDMGTGSPLYMHWWFTPLHVAELLHRAGLREADVEMDCCGNLFARLAFQMNLAAEELTRRELEFRDPGHPLLICVRAVKPAGWQVPRPEYRDPLWLPKGIPAKLHPVNGHYGGDYLHI